VAKREHYVRLPPDVRIKPSLAPLSESVSWADGMLGAEEAWKLSQGEGVVVCVLDTGCDVKHPDLGDGAIFDATDFTGSRYGYQDRNGHGTHVAGLIAARMGNDLGIRGIAPECRLVIAKVLGDNGSGSDAGIAQGIAWGLSKGATVFSLSLGGGFNMPATLDATKAVLQCGGRFLLAAAGNDGGEVNYPARYDQFVSVGAYDSHGMLTRFTSKRGRLDIVGPGVEMLSTLPGGGYGTMTGTSQACPIVAGITALAVAKHRDDGSDTDLRSVEDLREHLQKNATDTGRGYRLVNARKLLESHGVAPQPAGEWQPWLQFTPTWALCNRA
jgi:subtilisin family serine protease